MGGRLLVDQKEGSKIEEKAPKAEKCSRAGRRRAAQEVPVPGSPALRSAASCTGREARETVQIINKEEQGFSFAIQDDSRYSEGFSNSLVVCPMEGWIPPLSR